MTGDPQNGAAAVLDVVAHEEAQDAVGLAGVQLGLFEVVLVVADEDASRRFTTR